MGSLTCFLLFFHICSGTFQTLFGNVEKFTSTMESPNSVHKYKVSLAVEELPTLLPFLE